MNITNKIEKISNIIGNITDSEDREFYFEAFEKALKDIGEYVKNVYEMEMLSVIYKGKYEAREKAEKVNELDHKRRQAHNTMLYSFEKMNNVCKNLSIEPFYEEEIIKEGDGYTHETRIKASEFAWEILKDYYENRTK